MDELIKEFGDPVLAKQTAILKDLNAELTRERLAKFLIFRDAFEAIMDDHEELSYVAWDHKYEERSLWHVLDDLRRMV